MKMNKKDFKKMSCREIFEYLQKSVKAITNYTPEQIEKNKAMINEVLWLKLFKYRNETFLNILKMFEITSKKS